MKRLLTLSLAAIFALSFVWSVEAFDIGGTVKKTAKGAAKGETQRQYNKKLSKEKCRFVGTSTTEYTGCNVDKIIGELNGFRNAAEGSGFASDVNIIVETFGPDWTTARKRAEFMRSKVRAQVSASWDYSVKYHKAPSNEVLFQIEVR